MKVGRATRHPVLVESRRGTKKKVVFLSQCVRNGELKEMACKEAINTLSHPIRSRSVRVCVCVYCIKFSACCQRMQQIDVKNK